MAVGAGAGLWLRSAFFALLLPGTVVLWVPLVLVSAESGRLDLDGWRMIGSPLVVAGVAALVWCIADFARRGRGTLAPVDPPRFVVRSGLYRYVRNPMYVAVVVTLIGEAVLFESVWLLAWTGFVAVLVSAFVIGYEEPTLRAMFGRDYDEYAARTPRWLPRRPPTVGHPDQPQG